jgi:WD40 repeat protein
MPDFTNAKLTNHLVFEGNWPSSVAFIDNTRLVAGNLDGKLYLWDLTKAAVDLTEKEEKESEVRDRQPNIHPVRRLDGHTNGITRLFTADGGKLLVSASMDHTIRLWDTAAPSAGEADAVLDTNWRRERIRRDKSKEQEILAEPGIKVETQNSAHVLEGHQDWIYGCALSANGQRLVTGDYGGLVIAWDFPARREIKRWMGHKMDGVVSTAVSPDGKKCFVCEHRMRRGDYDRPPAQAKIFSLDDGAMLLDLLVIKFPDVKDEDRVNSYGYGEKWQKWVGHGFVAAAYSPDGKILAVAQGGESGDSQAHLIDAETGKEIRSVSKHEYGLCDLAFTPDGKYLFTAGRDTCAKVIQVEDGKEVAMLGKPRGGQFKDWFHAIAISPDQSRVAAADIAGLIHVWQLA